MTRVEASKSPLPSPRSRFTVVPVAPVAPVELAVPCPAQETGEATSQVSAADSKDTSPDYTSLIRSSPSKVVVGFDVLTT